MVVVAGGVVLSDEVRQALEQGKAVVALESTIISHGMPFPQNLHTAREVEQVVRDNGAVPATIAILDGVPRIGLDDASLERLARLGKSATKTSRRDIPVVVANKGNGATTVSATMLLAHFAGIRVFVTGGIGGVHRDGHISMDVSADLTELARTPVTVVCAGAKSILDIGRTLEFLETQGVPVIGYKTSQFPAFFTPASGFSCTHQARDAAHCADMLWSHQDMGLHNGMLLAVPIPSEHAAEGEMIEQATQQALREGAEQGVGGNAVTPFLLKRVNELTHGASLRANIYLVKNNAAVGSQVACQLAARASPSPSPSPSPSVPRVGEVLFVGGAVLDIVGRPKAQTKLQLRTSNPGAVHITCGGVARNVAEVAARAGANATLLSALGDDDAANTVLARTRAAGVQTNHVIKLQGRRTGVWQACVDEEGELLVSVADMDIFDAITPALLSRTLGEGVGGACIVFADTNLSEAALRDVARRCGESSTPLVVDPVSVAKSRRLCGVLGHVTVVVPNMLELAAMARELGVAHVPEPIEAINEAGVAALAKPLLACGTAHVVVTHAAQGVFHATLARDGSVSLAHFPAPPVSRIVSTNGAGDAFAGGLLVSLSRTLGGQRERVVDAAAVQRAVRLGMEAARITIQSPDNAPEELGQLRLGAAL